jgi:hypothetical protein
MALAGKRVGVVLATKSGDRRGKDGRYFPVSGPRYPERGMQMVNL